MASEREINPIPIHEPSGLGGNHDLNVIVTNEIISFRRWVAGYKESLMAAQEAAGYPQFVMIGPYKCHNYLPYIEQIWGYEPVVDFLKFLGMTDEDLANMILFDQQPGEQSIHYQWRSNLKCGDTDFQFFLQFLQQVLVDNDIQHIFLRQGLTIYPEDNFPLPEDRIAVSVADTGYDIHNNDSIYKEDYIVITDPNAPNIPNILDSHINSSEVSGAYKVNQERYNFNTELEFYDSSGDLVVLDEKIVMAFNSIIAIDRAELTSLSVNIVDEEQEYYEWAGMDPNTGTKSFIRPIVQEEIEINWTGLNWNRYACYDEFGEPTSDCGCNQYEDDLGWTHPDEPELDKKSFRTDFWFARDELVEQNDPINGIVGMFVEWDGLYYLREDFEQIATPDEIAYLISNFSYIEGKTEQESVTFIQGLIRLIANLFGAFLFFVGFTNTAQFMWSLTANVIGGIGKGLAIDKAEEIMEQAAKNAEEEAKARAEAEMLIAAQDNAIGLASANDITVMLQYKNKNPFALGFYNPLMESKDIQTNVYSVGGEFWNPHTKLKIGIEK